MKTETRTQTTTDYLESLNWRYATKKFDPGRKLSSEQLDGLLDAVQLSASSYGLQPYRVLVISDPEIREKLKPAAWNQSQITDASHLLVFAHLTDFGPELIDSYLSEVSESRNVPEANLAGYGDFMKSKLLDLPRETKAQWTARQAYIALGNLLSAAAHARIDTCPMEGFDAGQVDEILGLESQGLSAAVLACVGFRSEEDKTQHLSKVRRPQKTLFTHI